MLMNVYGLTEISAVSNMIFKFALTANYLACSPLFPFRLPSFLRITLFYLSYGRGKYLGACFQLILFCYKHGYRHL